MKKEWTKEQRHKHLREKYFKKREKFLTVFFIGMIFIIVLAGLSFAIQSLNIALIAVLLLLLIVMIPFSIFVVDTVFYETEQLSLQTLYNVSKFLLKK